MSGAPTELAPVPPRSGAARRVLVTRPPQQAHAWVDALRAHGIDALALPLIDTTAGADPEPVDRAWADLAQWSALVFVSPNAVLHFFARRTPGTPWPDRLLAAAPGPGTASELRSLGIDPDCIVEPAAGSERFDSESLWLQLQRHDWHGRRVLIVRGESGRDWLAGQLQHAGAAVDLLAAYRRAAAVLDPPLQAQLRTALAEPQRHLWFFSSSEAVQQLVRVARPDAQVLGRSAAIATHPRIARSAREAGFGQVLETRPGLADVVRCIQSPPAPDFSG